MKPFLTREFARYYCVWVGSHYIILACSDDSIDVSEFGRLIITITTTAPIDTVATTIASYLAKYRTTELDHAEWHAIAHAGIDGNTPSGKVMQTSLF